jgi:arylsulfatase A-like enzyme
MQLFKTLSTASVISWLLLTGTLFSISSCSKVIENSPTSQIEPLPLAEMISKGNDLQKLNPNIIIIMTDDQGYGDIGAHQNPVVKTPNIVALAKQSILLTNFHVDPTCSPTRAALMTGKHSMRAGVWHTVMGRSNLSAEHSTMAEILSEAGYSTAIFGKWHLGENYPFRPQDHGFDTAIIHGGGGVGQSGDYWGNTQFDDTYYRNGQPEYFKGYATDNWFDESIRYIREQATSPAPFFAYISTNAPHTPWRAPESEVQIYRDLGLPEPMARFYAMITNIDKGVGEIRSELINLGIDDNTLLVFMTDNGTSSLRPESSMFGDRDPETFLQAFKSDPRYASWVINAGMRGYKNEVYEGGHRVPFFIHYPKGNFGSPRNIASLTAHFDVLPTLIDLLDIASNKSDSIKLDGMSFLPLLENESKTIDTPFYENRKIVITNQRVNIPRIGRPMAVLSRDWRFISERDLGLEELYNIKEDPSQTNNLISSYPDIAQEHRVYLDQWWTELTPDIGEQVLPIVGSPFENPVRLNANDWADAESTSQIAWYPGFKTLLLDDTHAGWIHEPSSYEPLPWKVQVENAGEYRIRLFMYDKPAQSPIGKQFAFLNINGKEYRNDIGAEASGAEFRVKLERGPVKILGWFTNNSGPKLTTNRLPAFYAYVDYLN